MFLLYFRSEKKDLEKDLKKDDIKIIKKKKNYYTIICSNKKNFTFLKKEINTVATTNIYNNLIEDYIMVSPINIYKNNIEYSKIYNTSKEIFIKEIIRDLDKSEIMNFYDNDIINMNKNYIKFRKTIFLQNWDFLIELNDILKKKYNKNNYI